MAVHDWRTPPSSPDLATDEVHLWRAPLEISIDPSPSRLAVLSPDERARADRTPSTRRRRAFVSGRALLRGILGRYLRIPPERLQFQQGPHGKPRALVPSGCEELRFNVSHSGSLIVIVVARSREVGVDVESVRPTFDHAPFVERFFAPGERSQYAALPPERRSDAFWRGWVRKEAYLKARGSGLSLALDRFEVSLAPDGPAALLHVADQPSEESRWSLQDVEPGDGYVGAVAVDGHGWRPLYWRWAP